MYYPHQNLPGSSFFCFANQPNFNVIAGCDIVVVQRCCSMPQFQFINTCRQLGAKIVYDLDDDVWDLPEYNPAHGRLMQMRQGFIDCIRFTDLVTTSTHTLRKRIKANVKNMVNIATKREIPIMVAENWIDERLYATPIRRPEFVIGWSGSSSHVGDLLLVADALKSVANTRPDAFIEFRGCEPDESMRRLRNFYHKPWTAVAEFSARMPVWGWSIALAPLTDHPFNESKCLSPNTSVLGMKNGKIVRTELQEFLEDGKDHRLPGPDGRWRRVVAWEKQKYGAALSINMRSGDRLRVTPRHRFVFDGTEIEARHLKPGMVLQDADLSPFIDDSSGLLDFDAGWFVGHFIGDGNWGTQSGSGVRGGNTQIGFSCHADQNILHRKIKAFAEKHHAIVTEAKHSAKGIHIGISSPYVYGLIRQCVRGMTSHDKRLSVAAWNAGKAFLNGVIIGWSEAAGSYARPTTEGRPGRRAGVWNFGITQNWGWMRDVQAICSIVGYRMRYRRGFASAKGKQFKIIRGTINLNYVPYQSAISPFEVESVTKLRTSTIAVEVEGDHLFVLPSGLVTHNSCIKMVEAAYCRIPCLASWVKPYDDFASHDPELRWLLCAGPSSWKPKLKDLLNDDARREDLGQRMYQVMHDHYSFAQPHRGWAEAFKRVRDL